MSKDKFKTRKWPLYILVICAIILGIILGEKFIRSSLERKDKGLLDTIINTNQFDVSRFNSSFKSYSGTQSKFFSKTLFDRIVTSNKENKDHQVKITYNEQVFTTSEEIVNFKNSLLDDREYEISFDYDEDGYIYNVLVTLLPKKVSTSSFNFLLTGGTKYGNSLKNYLEDVIESNHKYENHQVFVTFKGTNYYSDDEIKDIKKRLDTWTQYEITVRYDEEGFIIQAIID